VNEDIMIMHGFHRGAFAAVIACALLPLGAGAQTSGVTLTPRIGLESYRFGDAASAGIESLSLMTFAFGAQSSIGRVGIDVDGAFARGTLTRPDGSDASVSGLTDTRVQLSLPLIAERWTVHAIGVLPTGNSELDDADAEVAGAIASDLLPFRISNWGSGGGLGFGSNLFGTVGEFGVGLGVTYLMGREFELGYIEDFAYRPGNMLAVRAAIDRAVGAGGKASLQLTVLQSTDDQGNGANFYRAGDRYQAVGSYSFAAGAEASGLLYGGVLHRTQGTYLLLESERAPSEDLVLAGGALRMRRGATLWQPLVELRLLRRQDGTGQGYLLGVGGSVERRISDRLAIAPTIKGRFGSVLVREGQESGFTGVDVGLAVNFGAVAR
jgi:hypothetical protein